MQSLIEKIYYGNYSYAENVKNGEEYKKLVLKCSELSALLAENFSEEQKKLLGEIIYTKTGAEVEAAQAHFIAGFKAGFNIAVECMVK